MERVNERRRAANGERRTANGFAISLSSRLILFRVSIYSF